LLQSQAIKGEHELPHSTPPGVQRLNGIVYTKGVHGDLQADIYLPEARGLSPAIVYLHGGAWKSGDRTQLQDVAMSLAAKGYVGIAIDYDRTDRGDRFPVALHEAERAVAWLREHVKEYGVDPKRVAVAGSSAGGELAALVALDRHPIEGAGVQAAVVFNGVLDLSYVGPDAEDMVRPYLGGLCSARERLCKEASPVFRVHPDSPPFFVGHGTADRIVPYSQAEHFVQALKRDGVQVTALVATGAGHTYWNTDKWYEANIAAVVDFLATAMPAR
jgi:acetyl esterase/lipase